MEDNIEPTSKRKFWRVLPRLQSISTIEVMRRFPVIEDLIAVLNRSKKCCQYVGKSKNAEGGYGFDDELLFGMCFGTVSAISYSAAKFHDQKMKLT